MKYPWRWLSCTLIAFFLFSSCAAKEEKKHAEGAGHISTIGAAIGSPGGFSQKGAEFYAGSDRQSQPAPTRKKNEVIGGIKMEQKIIKSLPGSSVPEDIFEPHMPGVDVLSDMDALFAKARHELETWGPNKASQLQEGQRSIAIITPGRMIMFVPAPPPGWTPPNEVDGIKKLLGSDRPLNISVISYTRLEALMEDKAKCIPFLGNLLAFAYLGHNVIVFEGHPSTLEAGVRNGDVLLIDSGMMPFLQEDWASVVYKAMKPGAKVFIHNRKTYNLLPIARKKSPPGWQYSEPDGEFSYVNCLLTTLAKVPSTPVKIYDGRGVPDIAKFTNDPDELDWIAGLPFKYDQLDGKAVIEIILSSAGWRQYSFFKTSGKIESVLATSGGKLEPVKYEVRLKKDKSGNRQVELWRIQQ